MAAKIREELRSKIARGSHGPENANEETFREDQLVQQLTRLQPRSKGGLIYQRYDRFQFVWRHPAVRLLFVTMLWLLDMYIFGEDPTTYSKTPCRIGGIGHIINLFLVGEEDTMHWILLRVILLILFVFAGLFAAKMLKKRLALRFEMFTYKGSYIIITATVVSIALVLCAKSYNWIRWKVTCNSATADCSCEDVKCGGYISNDLHIRNDTFAHLTQCGAFIADTLTLFGILDLILQDDSVYRWSENWQVSGFWARYRTRLLWGSFSVVMILGVPFIYFSSGGLLWYQRLGTGHRSNVGRMVVAGGLFIVDLCIVTQDLDFPHFENSLEVMLLGTNIAFEGAFINYIMVFVSMLLDLNCLYTHGWYRPSDYGQFYLENRRICNLNNTDVYRHVDCGSKTCPRVRLDPKLGFNGREACEDASLLLGSRYHPEIVKYRIYLAMFFILFGMILFVWLFRLAGRSPQNLCRRVVISNAFAAKKIEEYSYKESRSIEMAQVAGLPSVWAGGVPDLGTSVGTSFGTSRERLLVKLGEDATDVRRVIVVTASGVTAFELRDNPRSAQGAGALMRPHIFCNRLRLWLMRTFASWQGAPVEVHSSRDYLYARIQDLKVKLRAENLARMDVPFHSLELLWQGRLLHDEIILRSLGPDAVLYLLYDRWSLRRKRLAAWRAEVFEGLVAQ